MEKVNSTARAYSLQSLLLWAAEGTCWRGGSDNVKDSSMLTFSSVLALANSAVSSRPLCTMPTSASESKMHPKVKKQG